MKKKVLAIALALVLVLSMTSAFAQNCLTLDWSSSTNCGTGSIEVIPYVAGNKAGGYNTFTATDCAAAVNNQFIYFAIKITVAENPNEDWWKSAKLTISYDDGLDAPLYKYDGTTVQNDVSSWHLNTFNNQFSLYTLLQAAGGGSLKAGTYYVSHVGTASITDSFKPANNLFAAKVDDVGEGVEVCAKIKSTSASAANAAIEINSASVKVFSSTGTGTIRGTSDTWTYFISIDDVNVIFDGSTMKAVEVKQKDGSYNTYTSFNGNVFAGIHTAANTPNVAGSVVTAAAACDADYSDIMDAFGAINITWGQKISYAKAIDVLGWSDSISDCATWNDDAMAIVSPNCTVEIPKTGDVSVIAYAVMALVAAAGAMGLKK